MNGSTLARILSFILSSVQRLIHSGTVTVCVGSRSAAGFAGVGCRQYSTVVNNGINRYRVALDKLPSLFGRGVTFGTLDIQCARGIEPFIFQHEWQRQHQFGKV